MRLPALTIDSFRRSCHADIERIWKFMDLKTPEELRAGHSIRTLQSFRETLRLQWSQMDAAWQNHHLADSDADITVLEGLDAIVEATRVAIIHVLRISGDAISTQIPWRPAAPFDPVIPPYSALSDFHCRVMDSAHKDSPYARQSPNTGGAAKGADQASFAFSNRQPTQVTRAVSDPA